MKTNPGGQLPISDILGRETLIGELWEALERQSILITAERRIGKTSVIRKMCAAPPGEWVPVLQDLERIHTADEFATLVYEQVVQHLTRWQKTAHAARRVWEAIGGAEVGGSYYPKKEQVVTSVLDFLAKRVEPASVDEILKAAKKYVKNDRNQVLDLLKLLQRDHYLTRTSQGHFRFRFPLIQRWWRLDRGL